MTTYMQKIWFDGDKLVTQEIPETEIYKRFEWVGLTPEDINKSWEWAQKCSPYGVTRIETFARSIEKKLKEKNGY